MACLHWFRWTGVYLNHHSGAVGTQTRSGLYQLGRRRDYFWGAVIPVLLLFFLARTPRILSIHIFLVLCHVQKYVGFLKKVIMIRETIIWGPWASVFPCWAGTWAMCRHGFWWIRLTYRTLDLECLEEHPALFILQTGKLRFKLWRAFHSSFIEACLWCLTWQTRPVLCPLSAPMMLGPLALQVIMLLCTC